MADHKRLLELALKGLEVERRRIDEEVANIRKQLGGGGQASFRPQPQARPASPPQKGALTPAGRKALSDAMKRRWAIKKKALAKTR